MNSLPCKTAVAALLLLTSFASAQEQKKPDPAAPPPAAKTQVPMIRSFSGHGHVPVPAYLIEAEEKAHDANEKGEAFLKAGNADAALVLFREALSYSPQNGTAYLGIAHAYEAKGQLEQAAQADRLLFYDWPGKYVGSSAMSDSTSLMRFALVLLKLDQRVEALKVYQQGIHYLPTNRGPLPPLFTSSDFSIADFQASAYTAMGLHEMNGGGGADAPGYFERAIATQPGLPVAYFYRGEILKFQTGRGADAAAAFNQAEQLGGPEMKPFVDKARTGGTAEFTKALK